MRNAILPAALLLLTLAAAPRAHADAITLLSSTASTYTYGLTFTDASTAFNQHQTITITGLSGLTSISASSFASYLGYTTSTPTSITLTMAGAGTYAAGTTQALYTVTASSALANLGQYTIQESSTTESGSVAVTPEPAGFFLLATGALLLAVRPLRASIPSARKTPLAGA